MAKFKVGDIIKANKESNKEYLVTNQKNGLSMSWEYSIDMIEKV